MSEVKKPTIQIKTASPACPDIVGGWAVGQKNPNESVKYLIIQMAAYFGNADIFEPEVINTLNSLLSKKKVETLPFSILKEQSIESYEKEEIAATTPPLAAEKTDENGIRAKKKVDARFKTEPMGSMDIFDMKFINNLNSMFSQTETERIEPSPIKENSSKVDIEKEKAEILLQEAAGASPIKKDKEKNLKKKVGPRPGTASNIMQ